jgi:sulfopyruvate decarboxylase subunit alpha
MVTEPLLRTLGIPIWHLADPHHAQRRIKDAQTLAHAALSPVAVLLTREAMWEE